MHNNASKIELLGFFYGKCARVTGKLQFYSTKRIEIKTTVISEVKPHSRDVEVKTTIG